jgi:serine protease Do
VKQKRYSQLIKQRYQSSSLHPFNFFVPLVEQVKNGVVSIVTEDKPTPVPETSKLIRNFFNQHHDEEEHSERSFGSGFIFHSKGYILTSEHVIGKSKTILVKLCNGQVYEAKRITENHKKDYAVIKIDVNSKLQSLPLGSSTGAKVGEWVLSIGAPLGLENSVTVGIISAKNRRLQVSRRSYDEIIQTDAAINPGNSGGPLINMHGHVIGLNAFIIQSSQNLGFSIGIDSIKPHIQSLF